MPQPLRVPPAGGTPREVAAAVNQALDRYAGFAAYCQDISTKPLSSVIARFVSGIAWTLPKTIPNGDGKVGTAPSGSNVDFDLQQNGSSIGTVRWASGSTTATFIKSTDTSIAQGDYLDLVSPSSLHGMRGVFSLTILGTR